MTIKKEFLFKIIELAILDSKDDNRGVLPIIIDTSIIPSIPKNEVLHYRSFKDQLQFYYKGYLVILTYKQSGYYVPSNTIWIYYGNYKKSFRL